MTASMRLVHGGCGTGHFTVCGADNDLRNALATASDGVHRRPVSYTHLTLPTNREV